MKTLLGGLNYDDSGQRIDSIIYVDLYPGWTDLALLEYFILNVVKHFNTTL